MGSFVGKGMPELEKLNVIQQSGYIQEIWDAAFELLTNYQENADSDEYDEE